jgi:hypothetical protein
MHFPRLNPVTGVLVLWLASATPAQAQAREDEPRWWLGASALAFDYEEFDTAGASLDHEDGVVPGITGGIRWRARDWFTESELWLHTGRVDYEAPGNVTTRTDERIMDWSARVGRRLAGTERDRLAGYAGMGYRDWRRDIQSTTLFGEIEEYRWWYASLGLRGQHSIDPQNRVGLDIRWLRPLSPQLDVQFKGPYDDIELEPRAANGMRLSLEVEHDLASGLSVWLSTWFEYWKLDASPAVTLRQNGTAVVPAQFASEPQSQTRNAGITVGLVSRF